MMNDIADENRRAGVSGPRKTIGVISSEIEIPPPAGENAGVRDDAVYDIQ
jgi:hypothetical protein